MFSIWAPTVILKLVLTGCCEPVIAHDVIKTLTGSCFPVQAAVNRIERLEDATEEQLKIHNDVCAICYADMQVHKLVQ